MLELLTLIIAILIMVFFTQYVWNMIMPEVFKMPEITFLQTLGLLILSNMFFGSHCSASTILIR